MKIQTGWEIGEIGKAIYECVKENEETSLFDIAIAVIAERNRNDIT